MCASLQERTWLSDHKIHLKIVFLLINEYCGTVQLKYVLLSSVKVIQVVAEPNHVCSVLSHSVVSDSVIPWTVARQAPLSMGIFQVRILEWVAMPSSRGSSQPRNGTQISHIAGRFFTTELLGTD